MSIIPIFRRELVAAAREGKQRTERPAYTTMVFLVVGGPLAVWLYRGGGVLDAGTMGRLVGQALGFAVAIQGVSGAGMMIRGALAIAGERDRRTLDFLLVTPLSSGEIILGKMAAGVATSLGVMAAGFPIMLLLHSLGGVDLRVILATYLAFAMTPLMFGALAIWISVEQPGRRLAAAASVLATIGWMVGPFALSVFLPRMGIHPPRWLMTANWWATLSSPVWIAFRVVTGLREWEVLIFELGRMVALQLAGAILLTTLAIVRLRPAHRALAGVDRQAERRSRRRPVWRWRPRPPVGDDPILWREKYTCREGGFLKAITVLIWGGLSILLAMATFTFARAAFIELGRNGFATPATPLADMEMNVIVKLIVVGTSTGPDAARLDFNLFLRWASVSIVFLTSIVGAAFAYEAIGVERARGTWPSLLTTPLSARDILRAAILAGLWRARAAFGVVLVLWGLGLASGALHPLGVLVAALIAMAWIWMLSAFCVLEAIRAGKDTAEYTAASSRALPLVFLLATTGLLPWHLPPGLDSVLWGVGCLPLMLWTALFSYREVTGALVAPLDPGLRWLLPMGGQMPLLVAVAWLLAIVGPAAGGLWAWRYALRHFDRLVGRPHRPPQVEAAPPFPARVSPHPAAEPT